MENKNTPKVIITILILAVAVFAIAALSGVFKKPQQQVACTAEAKICPDGTSVGRTGAMCEFTACPTTNDGTKGWKTFTDSKRGFSFEYPEKLPTTYIISVDWPPKVNVFSKVFICPRGVTQTGVSGQTQDKRINGREYCVTSKSEGAAGSTYINFGYAVAKADKTVTFTFTIRAVQCANYDEPRKTECNKERSSFNIDSTIDAIAQTFQFKKF